MRAKETKHMTLLFKLRAASRWMGFVDSPTFGESENEAFRMVLSLDAKS